MGNSKHRFIKYISIHQQMKHCLRFWQIIIPKTNLSESHVILGSNIKRRERTTNILIIAFKSEKNASELHVVICFKDWIENFLIILASVFFSSYNHTNSKYS